MLLSNAADLDQIKAAYLHTIRGLIRIDFTVLTENYITNEIKDVQHPLSSRGPTESAYLPERVWCYKYGAIARCYDHMDNPILVPNSQSGTLKALMAEETFGWYLRHPDTENNATLLGEIFNWASLMELLKYNATYSCLPIIRAVDLVAHMGILGDGPDFRWRLFW
jgi:hypothetical protein